MVGAMRRSGWIVAAAVMSSGVIAGCKSSEPSGTLSHESTGVLAEFTDVLTAEDGGEVMGFAINTTGRPIRGCLISTYVLGPSASFGIARGWIADMGPGQRYDFRATWTWPEGFEPVAGCFTLYPVLQGITFGEPVVQLEDGSSWMTRLPRVGERVLWRMEAVANPETGTLDYRSIPSGGAYLGRIKAGEVTMVDDLRVRLDGGWVDWRNVVCWGTTLFPPN